MASDSVKLDQALARRLALKAAGLLRNAGNALPARAAGAGRRARRACHDVIDYFGYLQLDSIAVAGARTHGIVLASRIEGIHAAIAETLLAPGEPVFEYWGHEASWLPLSLYPCFEFRRREFRVHPWWGDFLGAHAKQAAWIMDRIASEGPVRSADLDDTTLPGTAAPRASSVEDSAWTNKHSTRLLEALWSAGRLAVRERRGFARVFDLPERVIPPAVLDSTVPETASIRTLLLRALTGLGFATTGTLAATWRLKNRRPQIDAALAELAHRDIVVPATLDTGQRELTGWILKRDLEHLDRLSRLRPRQDRGVLLSPFDPLLWDRTRTRMLFDFDLAVEIYKPAAQRQFGYYCLPVLAGDQLIGRVDLKADRGTRMLQVCSRHFETHTPSEAQRNATQSGLERFAQAVGLDLLGPQMSPLP